MNTFNKSGVRALLTVLVLSAGCASASDEGVFELTVPKIEAEVARVDQQVSEDVTNYFRKAASIPRSYMVRQSPRVEISAIETVIVEATRLPLETIVVVATRLPPVIETMVVEASRLPAMETVVVEATRLPAVVVASTSPARF